MLNCMLNLFYLHHNKIKMNPEVLIATVLEDRTPKKDNTYPIKLRITYRRKQRYFSTGISLDKNEFIKIMNGNPKGKLKEMRLYLNSFEQKAIDVIDAIKEFSFNEFRNIFSGEKEKKNDVFYLFENYVASLLKEDRIKTASSYNSASRSIKKFRGNKKLSLNDITPELLKQFEKQMLNQGSSITTVGIYLRSLRTIMNIAMSEGIISQVDYPFGRYKYQIPSSKNIKKAFPISVVQRIFEYKTVTPEEEKAKDFWIFSYLCNGINMKDIALLKNKNINSTEKKIQFIRSKTEKTSRLNLKPISVFITTDIQKIIKKWRTNDKTPEAFVFPVLKENMNAIDQTRKIEQFIRTTNRYLKRIGKKFELEIKFTSYTARHSYATIMKRSGAPALFISDSLGHSSLKTTENYFDSFEDESMEKYASHLTNFKTAESK